MAANAQAHAQAIRAARARIVAFPELSLTGYELDADVVGCDDAALGSIVDACGETGSIALAGAPVAGPAGRVHIATLAIDGDGARVAYRKSFLGGDEQARFAPGDGPAAMEVDGWRIGLGICKDTGVTAHVEAVAGLGVDLYVAGLVHHDHELTEQEARAERIARACGAYVAFASFAGPTGGGYRHTAGASAVWSASGRALARAGAGAGAYARATIT